MSASYNMFERYDTAIYNWLQPPTFLDTKTGTYDWSKRKVFAPPNRALSDFNRRLTGYQQERVPKPFISFYRQGAEFNINRSGNGEIVTSVDNVINPSIYKISHYPTAYDVTYQIDIWTAHEQHLNIILDWFRSQFYKGVHVFKNIEHGGFGLKDVYGHWDSESNTTEQIPGEEPTEYRYTITMHINGFMIVDYLEGAPGGGGGPSVGGEKEVRSVQEVQLDIYDNTDEDNPELLDTIEENS